MKMHRDRDVLRQLDRILSIELSEHKDPYRAIGAAQYVISQLLGETSECAREIAERLAKIVDQ